MSVSRRWWHCVPYCTLHAAARIYRGYFVRVPLQRDFKIWAESTSRYWTPLLKQRASQSGTHECGSSWRHRSCGAWKAWLARRVSIPVSKTRREQQLQHNFSISCRATVVPDLYSTVRVWSLRPPTRDCSKLCQRQQNYVALEPSPILSENQNIACSNHINNVGNMASLGEDLLGIVNKLQDLVFNTIGNDSLDLPQIVRTPPCDIVMLFWH